MAKSRRTFISNPPTVPSKTPRAKVFIQYASPAAVKFILKRPALGTTPAVHEEKDVLVVGKQAEIPFSEFIHYQNHGRAGLNQFTFEWRVGLVREAAAARWQIDCQIFDASAPIPEQNTVSPGNNLMRDPPGDPSFADMRENDVDDNEQQVTVFTDSGDYAATAIGTALTAGTLLRLA